jgi:hypothetical protein
VLRQPEGALEDQVVLAHRHARYQISTGHKYQSDKLRYTHSSAAHVSTDLATSPPVAIRQLASRTQKPPSLRAEPRDAGPSSRRSRDKRAPGRPQAEPRTPDRNSTHLQPGEHHQHQLGPDDGRWGWVEGVALGELTPRSPLGSDDRRASQARVQPVLLAINSRSSSSKSIGFVRWRSKPASRARVRSLVEP